jgi:hypothetical protein
MIPSLVLCVDDLNRKISCGSSTIMAVASGDRRSTSLRNSEHFPVLLRYGSLVGWCKICN